MNCQECENLMDEFFQHQLAVNSKKRIRKHLNICSSCRKTYHDYKNVIQVIQNLEIQSCPDEVVDNVFDILNLDRQSNYQLSWITKFAEYLSRYRFKIGLAGAVVMIIVSMILVYPIINPKPPVNQQYSNAQVELAKDEVKLALAYFNEITSRTQKIIEEQVLPKQVIAPMKSSIQTAIKPLMNGGDS